MSTAHEEAKLPQLAGTPSTAKEQIPGQYTKGEGHMTISLSPGHRTGNPYFLGMTWKIPCVNRA